MDLDLALETSASDIACRVPARYRPGEPAIAVRLLIGFSKDGARRPLYEVYCYSKRGEQVAPATARSFVEWEPLDQRDSIEALSSLGYEVPIEERQARIVAARKKNSIAYDPREQVEWVWNLWRTWEAGDHLASMVRSCRSGALER